MENLSDEFLLPPEAPGLANMRMPTPAMDAPVNKRARIEDAEDHKDQLSSHICYSEAYLHSVRQPICKEKTEFETFHDHDNAMGEAALGAIFKQKGVGISNMADEKCKPEGYRAIPKPTNCQYLMFCSFSVV